MEKTKLRGLTADEVVASRLEHGENVFVKKRTKGFFATFIENLGDPIIKVLLIALALEILVTLGRCNWIEVGGIVVAILIATSVTTLSECASAGAFERLNRDAMTRTVRVIRDGAEKEIPSSEVVVGDLLVLHPAQTVMADGVLISGSVTVDQSALNGESREVEKRAGALREEFSISSSTVVLSGSIVTSGEGIVHVRHVGEATYFGTVARGVQEDTRVSPLKHRLSSLAGVISKIGYCLAALVGCSYLFQAFVLEANFHPQAMRALLLNPVYLLSSLVHALTLMITVVVVAVPEGLPMMITVVLCANMKKMYSDGVLVKKPVGIETAGSMNFLFTDKTGTLTTGRLALDRIVTADGTVHSRRALSELGILSRRISQVARYDTDCTLQGGHILGGNGTDRAIFAWFCRDDGDGCRTESRIPFSSDRKYAAAVIRDHTERITLMKGAPELLLRRAAYSLRRDGRLTPFLKAEMEEEFIAAASAGERVLAMGYEREDGALVFLGLAVLKDKLRPEVKRTVRHLTEAGISVVMMTGDSKETATAIATECGIYRYGTAQVVLDSEELSRLSDDALAALLPRIRVLARAMPEDKSRLVRISQREGLVVGMTGDGINDAPSLRLADVGFSMGSGTDIAKEAGDVVILDNSLLSIANTVLYGRTIFSSIRKFITFQLVMNFAACGVSLLGRFIGIETPITVTQMLWVNLIMDTLGGLAFAGEAPLLSYMKEPPKGRDEPILTSQMISTILFLGSYTLVVCLAFLRSRMFFGLYRGECGGAVHLCAFYALFIFFGLSNALLCRSSRLSMFSGLSQNRAFLLLMGSVGVVQLLMIYFGGAVFRAVPLYGRELMAVLSLSLSVIPMELCRRVISRLL